MAPQLHEIAKELVYDQKVIFHRTSQIFLPHLLVNVSLWLAPLPFLTKVKEGHKLLYIVYAQSPNDKTINVLSIFTNYMWSILKNLLFNELKMQAQMKW